MQHTLKRFTIPALFAMVTLLTGVAAVSEMRVHPNREGSASLAFNEQLFVRSAFVRAEADFVTAPAHSTPIPFNVGAPTLHAAATFTVEVRSSNSFFPPSVTIAPGDTVVWQRTGGFHNVRADDGSFRLGEGVSGNPGSSWTTVSHTFTTTGTFRYFCEVHGGAGGLGMSGTVLVQDAAVTQTPTATSPSPTATATATLAATAPAPSKVYMPVITKS